MYSFIKGDKGDKIYSYLKSKKDMKRGYIIINKTFHLRKFFVTLVTLF
jgi:hypothetical protein